MKLAFAGLSDIGLSRPNNEDVWAAVPEMGFFALADGMGGHQAGEVAAKVAVDELCRRVQTSSLDPVLTLRLAIEKANEKVYEKGKKNQTLNGMGTTLCCLYWTQEAVIYAHVGDSRIYRFRKNKLEQLTQDHSLFAKWLSQGQAKTCETPYPYKNVITRAIGTAKRVTPEIAMAEYESGDLFILCSDGLTDALPFKDMEKILERSDSLDAAAARLIEKAKIKGSNDNITVLLIQHEPSDILRQ
jgi:protein phosphatase